MNRAQRMWSAGSLVVIGLVLAIFAVEWDARPPRDQGISILAIYETNKTEPLPPNIPPPPLGFIVVGEGALVWGGLFPLCLFAAAGLIALGGRRAGE